MALYMLCFYGHPTLSEWFQAECQKSGKKLDMGQGCVRFKTLSHPAADVVGRTVARVPVKTRVANYQAARDVMGKGKAGKAPQKKAAVRKAAPKRARTPQ